MTRVVSRRLLDKISQDLFTFARKKDQDMVIDYLNFYKDVVDENNHSMFGFRDSHRNNILLLSCIFKLENVILEIINNFSDSIDIGSINENSETALINCIGYDMYDIALELILKGKESNIEQITKGSNNSALDFMVKKQPKVIEDNVAVLVGLINYYLNNNPTSDNFHRNIDYMCTKANFFGPLLRAHFTKSELDFDKICKPKIPAETSNVVDTTPFNPRTNRNINVEATPLDNAPVAIPANDENFDANDYSSDEEDSYRLPYRTGGKHKHKYKRKYTNKKRLVRKTTYKQRQHRRR